VKAAREACAICVGVRATNENVHALTVDMKSSCVPNGHSVTRGGVAKKRPRSVQSTLRLEVDMKGTRVCIRVAANGCGDKHTRVCCDGEVCVSCDENVTTPGGAVDVKVLSGLVSKMSV
jgi:hypothetical protein